MHAGLLHSPHRQAAQGSCSSPLCPPTLPSPPGLISLGFTSLQGSPCHSSPLPPLPAPNPHLAPSLVSSVSPTSEQGLGQKGGLSSVTSPPFSNSPEHGWRLLPLPPHPSSVPATRPGQLHALLSSPKVSALSPHICFSQACGDLGPWEAPTLIHHPAADSLYTRCPHFLPPASQVSGLLWLHFP